LQVVATWVRAGFNVRVHVVPVMVAMGTSVGPGVPVVAGFSGVSPVGGRVVVVLVVVGVVGRPVPAAAAAAGGVVVVVVVVVRPPWVIPGSPTVRAVRWLRSNQKHRGAA